jgi:hypothetical protein
MTSLFRKGSLLQRPLRYFHPCPASCYRFSL